MTLTAAIKAWRNVPAEFQRSAIKRIQEGEVWCACDECAKADRVAVRLLRAASKARGRQ